MADDDPKLAAEQAKQNARISRALRKEMKAVQEQLRRESAESARKQRKEYEQRLAQREPPVLTVAQLRALLTDCPDYATVSIEGCDCCGDAGAVEHDGAKVLIRRTDRMG